MTAAHNMYHKVEVADQICAIESQTRAKQHSEADLSDPDDMWVDGAGAGWRAHTPAIPFTQPTHGVAQTPGACGGEYHMPELYNTTMLAVGFVR